MEFNEFSVSRAGAQRFIVLAISQGFLIDSGKNAEREPDFLALLTVDEAVDSVAEAVSILSDTKLRGVVCIPVAPDPESSAIEVDIS